MRIAVDAVSGRKTVDRRRGVETENTRPSFRNTFTVWLAEPTREKVSKKWADRFPDLCVGVEHDVAGLVVDESRRQGTMILATSRLVEDSAAQPGFEDVKFGLAHGAF